MILGDIAIQTALDAGTLIIDPLADGAIQPCSIDVRLHNEFRIFNEREYDYIDPSKSQSQLTRGWAADELLLDPGQFILGSTMEVIGLPWEPHEYPHDNLGLPLAAAVEGKSSLGRLGLVIHQTAGWIDPGWHGRITLELSNVAPMPILLRAGMKIGQIVVFETTPVAKPYGHVDLGSRYKGDMGPVASRAHLG